VPDPIVAGKSIVTRRAIVDIIRIAVQGSYGVMGFSDPSLGRRVLRLLGLDRPGVRLSTDGGLCVDVYIDVASGVPIAEVARQVESAVRWSIHQHLGLELTSLAVHVNGLRYSPSNMPVTEAVAEEKAAADADEGPQGHAQRRKAGSRRGRKTE
jgi:uncharacterized alkaline shock family protein YloU